MSLYSVWLWPDWVSPVEEPRIPLALAVGVSNGEERAEQERQRAEQEHQRAERLAARLRELGVDPDEE